MDIRLKVDWGASPQAPPGKTNESPPPKEEFERALHSAKSEETFREVAEIEPNAHLQNLDPEKSETVNETPLTIPILPIEIDPTILAQIWSSQLATPTALSQPGAFDFSLPVANPLQLLTADSKAVVEIMSSKIGDLFANQAVTVPTIGNLEVTLKLVQASRETETNLQANVAPVITTPQLLSSELKDSLNVTTVKATSSEVLTQIASSTLHAAVNTPKADLPNQDKSKAGQLAVNSQAVVSEGLESQSGSQSNFEQGPDQDMGSNQEDGTQPIFTNVNNQVQGADNIMSDPQILGRSMNSTERQAMVDSISRKIDELAAKSVRNEVRVEMHPPDLGSVVVNIRKDLTGLTATLNASNEPLRQALNESRNDLAGALADRNVGLVRIEVRGASSDTMNMGQQYNQAQSNQQHQQHHTKQPSQNAQLPVAKSKDAIDNPASRRTATTLLDMEI
jgi:Flagellar hook-length control protein FliK